MSWRYGWVWGCLLLVGLLGCGEAGVDDSVAVGELLPTLESTAVVMETAVATEAMLATFTPIPTLTNTPPPNSTPTRTPSPTMRPSPTKRATATPTVVPQVVGEVVLGSVETGEGTPTVSALITAVPTVAVPNNVTNILLIGADMSEGDPGQARTDTLIIASVNTAEKTASMLSIPRDLYVGMPGWNTNRINTVIARGDNGSYPGGGVQFLKDTILYNLGIPIHYYARVDFEGFKRIVDEMNGIEIAVSCELTDWRLKSPELDIYVEENYERFTLEPGIHQMDGELALWYARSRVTTSDFDRGRRQQQMLRAILNQGVDLNLLPQFPSLWEAFNETVETDLDIGRALQLATVATAVRENGIQHLYLTHGELSGFTVPETGAQVQVLNWGLARETFSRLYTLPDLNGTSRVPLTVEIINGTGNPDMARLAADNLAWYGFAPVIGEASDEVKKTSVTYYGRNFKGSYHWLVGWIFGLGRGEVTLDKESDSFYRYTVSLGNGYDPCRNPIFAPQPNTQTDNN